MFNNLLQFLRGSTIPQIILLAIVTLMVFAILLTKPWITFHLSKKNEERFERLEKQNRHYESQIRAFQEQHEQAVRDADWDEQEPFDIKRRLEKLFGHIQAWSSENFEKLESSDLFRDSDFAEELRKVSWNTDALFEDKVGVDFLMEAVVSHLLGKSILQDPIQWCDDSFQRWFSPLYSQLEKENSPMARKWARTTLKSYLATQTLDAFALKAFHTAFIGEISRSLQSVKGIIGRYCEIDETAALKASLCFIKLAAQVSIELYQRSGCFQLYDMAAIGGAHDITESPDDFEFRPMNLEDCPELVPNLILQPGILWAEDLDASRSYKKPSVLCSCR